MTKAERGAPVIRFANLSKTFSSGTRALGPIDLAIAEGEFLSLVGPSGCGKSTALRVIAGLLKPDSGIVEWPQGPLEIAFVFQEPTLMPWARAIDNVRLPLELKRVAATEAEGRAREALARVGLEGFERAYPRELSGGMRMRVSIARALVARPRILLMDEPFAALDEMTRQDLDDDFIRLWRNANENEIRGDELTVIFVTHSVSEAAYLSSRAVVMSPRPGRIVADFAMSRRPSPDFAYRFSPEFASDSNKITQALRGARATSEEQHP